MSTTVRAPVAGRVGESVRTLTAESEPGRTVFHVRLPRTHS